MSHTTTARSLGLALAQGIPFEQIAGADTAFEAPPDGKLSPCFLCIPLTMAKPLKCPGSDIEFHAEPSLLLAPFDIYDREESLGQELAAYDPNDPQQLLLLLDRYFFPCCEQASWSTAHKVMLTRSLQAALQSLQYDFAAPLEDSHDDCFYLPATWQIQAPRQFFLNAYSILLKRWVAEFATAGFSPMPAENLRHLA
ncbi:MAG: hypothetical protein L0H10_19340 [Comamonas sp.]|nr:hypothetical protein [Comamonas sp.]